MHCEWEGFQRGGVQSLRRIYAPGERGKRHREDLQVPFPVPLRRQ